MTTMQQLNNNKVLSRLLAICAFAFLISFTSCDDDPKPVNEEEVITTVNALLAPAGGGVSVNLRFTDPDGSGNGNPTTTVSGPLLAGKTYNGTITFQNESQATPVDLTAEILEEAEDHLLCFTSSDPVLTITPSDADDKGLPIGLSSTWVTTTAGTANVKIVLRHQPGTKTGQCPGSGETDVEINFEVLVR